MSGSHTQSYNCLDGTLLRTPTFGSEKKNIHLSLGKVGSFTSESHIHVKALKRKVFQIIRCLIKPLSKKPHPNNFSRGYLMSGSHTQSYNCLDGTLLRTTTFGSEIQKHFSTFLWVKLVPLLQKAISMSKP